MTIFIKDLICLTLMVVALVIGSFTQPTLFIADTRPSIDLEKIIPIQLGGWKKTNGSYGQIVNPQQKEKLESLYSQLLSRTYVNAEGQQVMLSIAYGRDQRSYMAVHYPEVCYPAQGFAVSTNKISSIETNGQTLPVRHLETKQGDRRIEPVTYWTTIGEYRSLGGVGKRMLQLKYGLEGKIPDGILFRVSSIGANTEQQFRLQNSFISALLSSIPLYERNLINGKN